MSGDESVEAWFAGLQPCACSLRAFRLCACSSHFWLLKENYHDSRLQPFVERIIRGEPDSSWVTGGDGLIFGNNNAAERSGGLCQVPKLFHLSRAWIGQFASVQTHFNGFEKNMHLCPVSCPECNYK